VNPAITKLWKKSACLSEISLHAIVTKNLVEAIRTLSPIHSFPGMNLTSRRFRKYLAFDSAGKERGAHRGPLAYARIVSLLLLFLLVRLPANAAAGTAFGNTHHSHPATDGAKTVSPDWFSSRASSASNQENAVPLSTCGPPDYKCSYDGIDPKPLCTNCNFPPVPDMSAEPNAVWYDKVLGASGSGNQIVRCTYPDTLEHNNHIYVIGSGGSGDSHVMGKAGGSPPTYRLIIGDTHGWAFPFTYTPDPIHPTCRPTYSPMSSFPVGDGTFSWVTPHLYYYFGGNNFKVKAVDLGAATPSRPVPLLDFQQILPRTGPDWPGAASAVSLGTIIAPRSGNPGNYLYQATCPARQVSCAAGITGNATPAFSQRVMTNTGDGTVIWRNIGVGFNGSATWTTIGGVSTDDDVFVKGFSDAGGQGGLGAVFAAAYKRSTNIYYLYNVGTGIISYFKCTGGSDYKCSGGRWTETILGMTALPDRFLLHNVKVNKDGQWIVLVQDDCRFGTCSIIPGSFGPYFWQLSTTETNVTKVISHPYGHWTEGYRIFVNQDGDPGVTLNARPFADPDNEFPFNRFPANSVPVPIEAVDAHPSWNFNDGTDTTPICTATVGLDWPYSVPWENEVVCYGTNPEANCSTPGHGVCQTTIKRFFHTYNPGTCDQNNGFWGCWGIGTLSQDGKYYAFTSNWGDTLGSILSGGHGPGSCTGGFNFQKNHDYEVGDVFEPSNGGHGHSNSSFNAYKVTVAGRAGSYPPGPWPTGWRLKQNPGQGYYQNGEIALPRFGNSCNHLFRVTAGGGTANGSKVPDWQKAYNYHGSCGSVAVGETISDGGITWTDTGEFVLGTIHLANAGHDDCRSDVFIGALN
jgi:hypothetical protein